MIFLLLTILLFLLFPVPSLVLSVVGVVIDKKLSKLYLILVCLSISIISLRYIPHPLDDGAFHFRAVSVLANYNNVVQLFKDFASGLQIGRYDYGSVPVFTLLMYLVRNTYHYSLLSFISAFVTYFSFGYVVIDIFNSYRKCSKLSYIIVFLTVLILNNYRYTTSGMRFCMAVSLIMLLLYIDSKNEYTDFKTIFLYLIPLGIHSAIIYFIALRLAFPILKKVTILKSIVMMLSFPILFGVFPLIARWTGLAYFESFVRKIEIYSDNTSYADLFNTTLTVRLYVGLLLMFLFLVMYLILGKIVRFEKDWRITFVKMTYYITLLSVGSVPFRNIYDRNLFLLLPMIVISAYVLFTYRNRLTIPSNRNFIYLGTFSTVSISLFIGILYNRNFPFNLIDFSKTDLLVKNIFQFFSDLPFT